MSDWFTSAIGDAVNSTLGWAGVMAGTLVVGFCAGYWIGHREIVDAGATMRAFVQLPFLWLGFKQMFLAYAVLALAWYLPLRYDSIRLRIVAAVANLLVWLIVVASVVVQSSDAKFFQY